MCIVNLLNYQQITFSAQLRGSRNEMNLSTSVPTYFPAFLTSEFKNNFTCI